jgi:hypothetical protein
MQGSGTWAFASLASACSQTNGGERARGGPRTAVTADVQGNSCTRPFLADDATRALLRTRLSGPLRAGLQRIQLADYGVRLAQHVPYRFAIAIVGESQRSSHGTMACGTIQRVALPESLQQRLARSGPVQAPALYAEAGLWYAAVAAIADLHEATPRIPPSNNSTARCWSKEDCGTSRSMRGTAVALREPGAGLACTPIPLAPACPGSC